VFPRLLTPPNKTFFLFGPRGTGKSTWLAEQFGKAALSLDLLSSRTYLDLLASPGKLRDLTAHLKKGQWVVIDEVQRVPALLNEVHALYETRGLHFALSGSSARKLKRGGGNLLAGRALQRQMFPLIAPELPSEWSLEQRLAWGTLPGVVADPKHKKDTLSAYVETYLRQEVMEEGLLRKLEPYARFLRIAGVYNGQVLSVENIARQSQVARATVDRYFEILEDTLLARRLPSYRPGALVKEISHPKFYFFDSGVARAAAGLIDEPIDSVWKGFSLETTLLSELLAYNHYAGKNRELGYYQAASGLEIDFIVELRKKTLSQKASILCIEVKSSSSWDWRWSKPALALKERSQAVSVERCLGVYLGQERLSRAGFEVWPLGSFLEELHAGGIF